jgi:sodium-dependent dicarboxylate transporter 2/3/5
MKIGLPVALTMLLACFGLFYIGLGNERSEKQAHFHVERHPWTKNQKRVLTIFAVVVVLWSFKELILQWIGFTYRDESVAILGGISLFLLPGENKKKLLDWKDTEKLPWGILILFGGGLALATMFEENGVIEELSSLFAQLNGTSYFVLLLIVIVGAVFASEVLSNLAMVSIFTPLVAAFALEYGLEITSLVIPLTLGASLAFMLPVGTPPNAIVFSSGLLKVNQMVRYGFILNVIGIAIMFMFSLLILG